MDRFVEVKRIIYQPGRNVRLKRTREHYYASAVNAMTGIGSVANPIPRNRDIYSELYNRIYKKTYGRQGPLFKELLRIAEMFPEEMK